MVYSDTGERYLTKHEEHYLKTGDVTDSISSSSTYPDMWRPGSPADKSDLSSRSPLELHTGGYAPVGVGVGVGMGGGGLGGGGGMCGPHEMENFHNVLAFSPCPPSYKEFAVFKEKSSHDVTDALLSLKNAIVHPSFAGSQLSPLSPTMHLGPLTPTGINGQGQQPLAYTVNHSTQVHPMSYSGRSSPQYPSVHAQIHGDHINTHQQHGHSVFPAMSVNVSMSMNVVPPNFANNQYNPGQQWQSPSQHYNMDQEYPHSPQEAAFQTQYNPYSQNYYSQSYSISPDFRSAMTENRNFYYKTADEFKSSNTRYYTSAHFKRAKFIDDKSLHISANSPDNSKINLCRICGKTYARPSTLKTHLRTHSGEKPYKCNACNKSFSQAANLTAHARTHSGEKPFHCPVCDRHFSQSSSVTTHMRTHSGERPYRCRLCKKAFSDSSTLTKHLRIHSGEKPYQCKLCLLRFSQSGNLNRHMRVHSSNG